MERVDKTPWQKYYLLIIFLILLVVVVSLFYVDLKGRDHRLTFAMLDVGQGDALFIESPTGTQVLVDVGPPKQIMSELSRVMSPFDRHIDAVIITNPDADHIGGFSEVLKKYKIEQFFEPGTNNDSKMYQNLESEIKTKNISRTIVERGMQLDIGGGAYIDILFPDQDVSSWDSNDGSIVAKLTYGATTIMLTGDSTMKTEKIILSENSKEALDVDILKVGHHGSRTSTSSEFIKVLSPQYALISNGKDNKYGHPHQEVLTDLEQFGVQILRTDLLGTVIMKCDTIGPCEIKKSKN